MFARNLLPPSRFVVVGVVAIISCVLFVIFTSSSASGPREGADSHNLFLHSGRLFRSGFEKLRTDESGKMGEFEERWSGEMELKALPYPVPDNFESLEPTGNADKWIIVTSIQGPTNDTIHLAQIEGWRLLIVADLKTPKNYYIPGAEVLSVNEQKLLTFRLRRSLPWRQYARKNIGYLYAISKGARIIYETDDDNHPTDDLRSFETDLTTDYRLIYSAPPGRTQINPYSHFGQSSIWPRGFDLSQISNDAVRKYRLCKFGTPTVQQGLVNGDPDVDAIFRLTRKHATTPIDLTFDQSAPPVAFPSSVLSPFNSQNTLFHYDAFWALLLPIDVSMRVIDIWRSFYVAPLMAASGQKYAFYPPNARQERNAHDYLADFMSEMQIYNQTRDMSAFLTSFSCSRDSNLASSYVRLMGALVGRRFMRESMNGLLRDWIDDLNDIGYEWPKLNNSDDPAVCLSDLVHFYPNEQPTIMFDRKNLISLSPSPPNLCPSSTSPIIDDAILISQGGQDFIDRKLLPKLFLRNFDYFMSQFFRNRFYCFSEEIEAVLRDDPTLRLSYISSGGEVARCSPALTKTFRHLKQRIKLCRIRSQAVSSSPFSCDLSLDDVCSFSTL